MRQVGGRNDMADRSGLKSARPLAKSPHADSGRLVELKALYRLGSAESHVPERYRVTRVREDAASGGKVQDLASDVK
jgi:hypothetical protein